MTRGCNNQPTRRFRLLAAMLAGFLPLSASAWNFAQAGDAFLGRRVRAEQALDAAARERVHDHHLRRRRMLPRPAASECRARRR
jgi:hypothetical protein